MSESDDLASAFRSPPRVVRSSDRKQLGISGIAREYNAIEQAAEALREAERQVKAAGELKQDMADKLLFTLINEGVRSYKYTDSEGRRFTVRAKTKQSVEIKRGWESEEGEE